MVCILTVKDAKIKIKIQEKYYWRGNHLYRQRYCYQPRSEKKKHKKSKQKINEVYVYNKFYFQILNESKAFILLA